MRHIFCTLKSSFYLILRAYFNLDSETSLPILDLDLDPLKCRVEKVVSYTELLQTYLKVFQ